MRVLIRMSIVSAERVRRIYGRAGFVHVLERVLCMPLIGYKSIEVVCERRDGGSRAPGDGP